MAFLITKRNRNLFATYAKTTPFNFLKANDVPEEDVKLCQSQLRQAEIQGTFGFTSFPVLTLGHLP